MKTTMAAILALSAGAACAALGDRPATAGATSLAATTAAGAPYRQWVTQLDSGTTVREFADAQGTVFAVSWSGPFLPDLRTLLGAHFAALKQAEATATGRSASISISNPGFALVSSGHMRAFQGKAWLPGALPAGFDPAEMP